jgi:methylthioribulose-1-phosphate dehydratase
VDQLLRANPVMATKTEAPDPKNDLALGLCEVMAAIDRRGWCDGTGGNFSCVLRPQPLALLMAPSGVEKGGLKPRDLIVVNDKGEVIEGEGRASAETLLHLAIVAARKAGAVLHTHSQAATLLSRLAEFRGESLPAQGWQLQIKGLEMLKGLQGIRSHEQQISIPVLPNDQDLEQLSQLALSSLADAPFGILISGHGLYAWGDDLAMAKRHLEILEFLLEQHWRELQLRSICNAGVTRP